MKDGEKFIDVFYLNDFTKWLEKNHEKERKIGLILHKKHTGKPTVGHMDLMKEAICFGWIDSNIQAFDDLSETTRKGYFFCCGWFEKKYFKEK